MPAKLMHFLGFFGKVQSMAALFLSLFSWFFECAIFCKSDILSIDA